MSKAKSPEKVIRTAIKRIEGGPKAKSWIHLSRDPVTRRKQASFCMEGALFGGCTNPTTVPQAKALEAAQAVLAERHGCNVVPQFNDAREGIEECVEVFKLALIRLETDIDFKGAPLSNDTKRRLAIGKANEEREMRAISLGNPELL